MAVPKRKKSYSATRMRRSHDKLASATYREDEAGDVHRPHHINPKTGQYRGRQILPVPQAEGDEDAD